MHDPAKEDPVEEQRIYSTPCSTQGEAAQAVNEHAEDSHYDTNDRHEPDTVRVGEVVVPAEEICDVHKADESTEE